MHTLRIPIAGVTGALFTASMFWLLWSFVETSFDAGDRVEAPRIEYTRIRPDTAVEQKRRQNRIERTPPPTLTAPRLLKVIGDGVDNHVARLMPAINTRGAATRIPLTAGSDRDVIPLVRMNPDYPPSALRRELEGWVQVQFTITPTGTVKDAIVVDAEPADVFDEAALKAIARWRYNPKVENGTAVERVGVQTRIVFQLDQ